MGKTKLFDKEIVKDKENRALEIPNYEFNQEFQVNMLTGS